MWNQEGIFKIIFSLAIIMFALVMVGFFLLGIKIILLFQPEIDFIGLHITHL
ncbi:MAG: hypothetical protein V1765_01775 [bacterium]